MNADRRQAVRIEPVRGPVTIEVRREPIARTPEQEHEIERAWRGMCAQNPRYFDGRVLSFESYDAATGTATARDVAYRLHAVRDTVDSGVVFLGVTGVLRVVENGVARFMLGRRGASVHEYPGQWEFAPCGGIDPPPVGHAGLSQEQIEHELSREAREELGIDLMGLDQRPLALVHDDPVGSTDLMMLVDLPAVPAVPAGANWEYTRVRWLTLDEIQALHASPGQAVIPTTLAMVGWLRENADEPRQTPPPA